MKLGAARFYGVTWSEADTERWGALSNSATMLARKAVRGERFDRLLLEVRRLLATDQIDKVRAHLTSRRFARAVVTVWRDDAELAERTLRRALLDDLLSAQQERTSRLLLLALVDLHLQHFETLDRWEQGLFAFIGRSLRTAVGALPRSQGSKDLLEHVRISPELFLDQKSPRALAAHLVEEQRDFADFMTSTGVAGHDLGLFGKHVRREVFLERIRQADPSEENEFLDEFENPSLIEAPDGQLLFGHALIAELAMRPERAPHEQWVKATLHIAGDPRTKNRDSYAKWWARIDSRYAERVANWLSEEDLRLFLRAIERFGVETANDPLNRLFPGRKTFLWGLYELGLVKETRLIVGQNVRRRLGNYLKPGFRTDIAELRDRPDTSLIAIDCGSFSLVEGSHNAKLWIFEGPRDDGLFARDKARWEYADATTMTFARLRKAREATGNQRWALDGYTAITHQGLWQRKALEFLAARGINVQPRAVLDKDDYRRLKFQYGLPIVRQRR